MKFRAINYDSDRGNWRLFSDCLRLLVARTVDEIPALLAEAELSLSELDGLAFACGPGSFTGVRIATSVIQGVALAADLPVIPVSSLQALAQSAIGQGAERVLAGFDARMQEVYWATYVRDPSGFAISDTSEQLLKPDDIVPPEQGNWVGIGSAWETYQEVLAMHLGDRLERVIEHAMVHAADVARLAEPRLRAGEGVDAAHALPVYLRDQVAQKSLKR